MRTSGAIIIGSDLSRSFMLGVDQVATAHGDGSTRLPEGVQRPDAWPARARGGQPAALHATLAGVACCFRLFAFRLCRSECNPARFGCPRTGVNAIGGTASKSAVLQLATRANALFSAVLSTPTRRNQQSAYCANRYNCDIIVT